MKKDIPQHIYLSALGAVLAKHPDAAFAFREQGWVVVVGMLELSGPFPTVDRAAVDAAERITGTVIYPQKAAAPRSMCAKIRELLAHPITTLRQITID